MFKKLLMLAFVLQSVYAFAQRPFFPTKKNNKWVYLDLQGREVLTIALEVEKLLPFYEDMAVAQDAKTQKFGYLNTKGQWAILPTYTKAGNFNKGAAVVYMPCQSNCTKSEEGLLFGGISQLIDKAGKVLLNDNSQDDEPYKRFQFADYNDGERLVAVWGLGLGDYKSLMDRNGIVLSDRVVSLSPLGISEGLMACRSARNPCYTDKNGKKLIDASKYQYLNDFVGGYAWVGLYVEAEEQEYHILLDKKGKAVLKLSHKDFISVSVVGDGMFVGSPDYIQNIYYKINGKKAFEGSYLTAKPFSHGLAFVAEGEEKMGYINTAGKVVIDVSTIGTSLNYGSFTAEGYAFVYAEGTEEGNEMSVVGMLLKDGRYFPNTSTE